MQNNQLSNDIEKPYQNLTQWNPIISISVVADDFQGMAHLLGVWIEEKLSCGHEIYSVLFAGETLLISAAEQVQNVQPASSPP